MYGLPLQPPSVCSSGPPSPSRNHPPAISTPLIGQMYRRVGQAHQQRTTWFGGGYCTTYGLNDPLPSFQENDPFAWQVEGIEKHRAAFALQHRVPIDTQLQMQREFQAEMDRQKMQMQLRRRLLGRGEGHGMLTQGEDFMVARSYFEKQTGYTQESQGEDEDEVQELRVPPSTPEWVLAQPTQIPALSDLGDVKDGAIGDGQKGSVERSTSAGSVKTGTHFNGTISGRVATPGVGSNQFSNYRARTSMTIPGLRMSGRSTLNRPNLNTNTSDGKSSDKSRSDGKSDEPVVGDSEPSPDEKVSANSGKASNGSSPDRSVPRNIGSCTAHRLQTYLQISNPEINIATINDHASENETEPEPADDEEPSTPEVHNTAMTAQEFFWEEMRAYTRGEGPRDPSEPLLPFIYTGSPDAYRNYVYVPMEPERAEGEDSEETSESDSDDSEEYSQYEF